MHKHLWAYALTISCLLLSSSLADEAGNKLTPPKSGPTIREITRITQTSLFARFKGEEVWTIDWEIKSGKGAVIAAGSFNPSNSAPFITYPKLAPGRYTLTMRGQSSKTVDAMAFEVQADPVVNMGVIEQTAGGQKFGIINARDSRIEVLPSGAVRLVYPETKPSQNNKNQTKAWVMNSYMIPLHEDELKTLSSPTGLKLPEGNHTFYIYYFDPEKAKTPAELRSHWWEVLGNPDTFPSHMSGMEYVLLEIQNVKPRPSNEVKAPRDIRTVTWYPQYQQTAHKLNLPEGKQFGVTKRVSGIPAKQLVEQGTDLQAVYEDVNNLGVPYDKTWVTLRAYAKGEINEPYSGTIKPGESVTVDKEGVNCKPGDLISLYKGYYGAQLPDGVSIDYSIPSEGVFRFEIRNNSSEEKTVSGGTLSAKYFSDLEDEARKLYDYGARKGCIVASEICENGLVYDDVEKIYRRIYELQVEKDGVTSPNDTDIIADYFGHIYGYGTEFGDLKNAEDKRKLFSSPENAKRFVPDGDPSRYYANKAYEYRHRLVGGYLDGISRLLDGVRIYGHIASLEKQYIAMPDIKAATFGWTAFEGVGSQAERGATWQRLPLEGGDLIRLSRPEGSFEQLKYETFISLLIGDYYVSWNDNGMYGTNINGFGLAHIGGGADWKNQWQPRGGEVVQYDPNNPTHPTSNSEGGGWSDGAAPGHNGGFVGAWLLTQIRDRIETSLRYPTFSYSIGNKTYTGYFNGDKPVTGELGNSEVSRFGVSNPGQCNIINQEEHRKPIVFYGEGKGGDCLIVMNPYAGLTETTTYTVREGEAITVRHTGPYLGVYKLDTKR